MPQVIAAKIRCLPYSECKQAMKAMTRDSKILFEREPHNPHDANAIALYAEYTAPSFSADMGNGERIETADLQMRKVKIGYVPRERAAALKNVKIIAMTRGDIWDTVNIEIA